MRPQRFRQPAPWWTLWELSAPGVRRAAGLGTLLVCAIPGQPCSPTHACIPSEHQSKCQNTRRLHLCMTDPLSLYWNGKAAYMLKIYRTSLLSQWLRVLLPTQERRFDPWSGKIPPAMEQLSPGVTTAEPHTTSTETRACLEPMCHRKGSRCKEKSMHHNWRKTVCSHEDPVPPKINKKYRWMCITASFITAPDWKQPECSSPMSEQIVVWITTQ